MSKGYNEDGGKWSEPPSTEGLEELDIDSSSTLYDAIVECRVIKTPEEIELLRFANDLSSEAHFEVGRLPHPCRALAVPMLNESCRTWVAGAMSSVLCPTNSEGHILLFFAFHWRTKVFSRNVIGLSVIRYDTHKSAVGDPRGTA